MITKSTYKAAKVVAKDLENHFSQHLAEAKSRGNKELASEPSSLIIEALIDAAFWASLRREEGNSPRISLALLSPEQAGQPLIFERPVPLTPSMLTKIAPGFERPGIHLGIWHSGPDLFIWGATSKIPNFCFVLDVPEPGLLVIKHRRLDGFGKFTNVAVLIGDEIKIVDEHSVKMPDCPALLTSLLDFTYPSSPGDSVNVLLQLAVSMRSHKKGGTMLVVPSSNQEWRESIRHPLNYSVHPSFSALAALVSEEEGKRLPTLWQGVLSREVDIVAGLTAIDGAIVLNDQYELLAFGAKIKRREGKALVEQIIITEPIVGGDAMLVNPAQSGGTRHLSAAQFVHDQRDALALVASQDGNFTVYSWSPCENMVHAHRIDSLLI